MDCSHVKIGDVVTRMLAGVVPMDLRVTSVTEHDIVCGEHGWRFDRETGAEIDDDLGWGPPPLTSGSYISAVKEGAT